MYRWMSGIVVAVSSFSVSGASGETKDEGLSPPSDTTTSDASNFHARAGFGVTPVVLRSTDHLPTAHHGVGAFFTAFAELPYRLSLGGGFDWERYSYETTTTEGGLHDHPVFPEETLTHTRLLGVVEWSILDRGLVNPYLLAVTGWAWEQATKTSSHCLPQTASGPVVGGGAGVDVAASSWLALGVEYRLTTQPFVSISCSDIEDPDDPMGPPSDFIPQRIALTLSVNDAF